MWRTAKRPFGVGCFFDPTATEYRFTSVAPMRTTRMRFCVETAIDSGPLTTLVAAKSTSSRVCTGGISARYLPPKLRLREALDRVRLALVHAEHRQQIGQAQRLPHAVLRLEQAERRAEALRGLEALHQLSQTVAVDVVHFRKVEQ